jgi:hypothetical protein
MSIQLYNTPSIATSATIPIETGMPFWEEKKGGKGGSSGGKGGSGSGGGNAGSPGGRVGSQGRTPGNFYYNGRNYMYGYPVRYNGNRYYPGGMIVPVAFGGAAGYLIAGHIYHTYTSDSTLIYSEVPTMCGTDLSSTSSDSTDSYHTCISSFTSFTDGGLVTIQQDELDSASYQTLSDNSTIITSTVVSTTTSQTETSVTNTITETVVPSSVSSISSHKANNGSSHRISWSALVVALLALSI